jgi:hypothetical protein
MSSDNELSAGDDEYDEKREVTTVLFVLWTLLTHNTHHSCSNALENEGKGTTVE